MYEKGENNFEKWKQFVWKNFPLDFTCPSVFVSIDVMKSVQVSKQLKAR